MKKEDFDFSKKDMDVQMYLLNGSLETQKNQEETFLCRFEQMAGECLIALNELLAEH
jgi:hypothetical protein